MSAITAKASRKMKKYAVLTREPRCFLGSFDFSWEQRKLGEVFNFHYGDGNNNPSNGGQYPVLVQVAFRGDTPNTMLKTL